MCWSCQGIIILFLEIFKYSKKWKKNYEGKIFNFSEVKKNSKAN
jgi:hypothetical protein